MNIFCLPAQKKICKSCVRKGQLRILSLYNGGVCGTFGKPLVCWVGKRNPELVVEVHSGRKWWGTLILYTRWLIQMIELFVCHFGIHGRVGFILAPPGFVAEIWFVFLSGDEFVSQVVIFVWWHSCWILESVGSKWSDNTIFVGNSNVNHIQIRF